MASEWMATNYGDKEHYINYPLGPLPPGISDMARATPWLRKVDGLAISNGQVDLIEFKVWTPLDGLDKLPTYKAAVPQTPWLGVAKDYPVNMILVTPRPNDYLIATAKLIGVNVITVSGGWIDEVVAHIEWLWTKEGRDAMAEKKRLRAWLGVD